MLLQGFINFLLKHCIGCLLLTTHHKQTNHGVSWWFSRSASSAAASPPCWQRCTATAWPRDARPSRPPTARPTAAAATTTTSGRCCCLAVQCSSTASTGRSGRWAARGADGGHEPGRSATSRATVSLLVDGLGSDLVGLLANKYR